MGIHVHERGGSAEVVGLEVFTEEPGDVRTSQGPSSGSAVGDLLPFPPTALRASDVDGVRIGKLLERFGRSSDEAFEMVGPRPSHYTPLTRHHLGEVARVVIITRAGGSHKIAVAVAERWSVSNVTARKWIGRARAEGFLPKV